MTTADKDLHERISKWCGTTIAISIAGGCAGIAVALVVWTMRRALGL